MFIYWRICVILGDGLPVATYTYTAFGETTHTGTLHSPWQFSGYRCDADTHLFHAQKRVYDSSLGRWLTPDPLGFTEGPNLYAYVHNNSLIFIDPTGLWGEWISSAYDSICDAFSSAYDSVCSAGRCFARGYFDDRSWGTTECSFGECQREGPWEHGAYYAGMGLSLYQGYRDGSTALKGVCYGGRFILKEAEKHLAKEGYKTLSKRLSKWTGKESYKEIFIKSANNEIRNGGSKINREFWSKGGYEHDRGGLSKAGRAWQKKAGRPDSVFPKAKGSLNQVNRGGQEILDNILNDPNTRACRQLSHITDAAK